MRDQLIAAVSPSGSPVLSESTEWDGGWGGGRLCRQCMSLDVYTCFRYASSHLLHAEYLNVCTVHVFVMLPMYNHLYS